MDVHVVAQISKVVLREDSLRRLIEEALSIQLEVAPASCHQASWNRVAHVERVYTLGDEDSAQRLHHPSHNLGVLLVDRFFGGHKVRSPSVRRLKLQFHNLPRIVKVDAVTRVVSTHVHRGMAVLVRCDVKVGRLERI